MIQKVYELAEVEVERQRVFAVGEEVLRELLKWHQIAMYLSHEKDCDEDCDAEDCDKCKDECKEFDGIWAILEAKTPE
jgi:hypothetical protein